MCRIERSAQCRIARTHHVAPALLQWDECREHSKPGGGCLDERRPLRCGQDLYCLSQPPHHGSRNSTKTSFPHRLLQCRQRGYRIKVRCERQCREQEPRHPHRRNSQRRLHSTEPPLALRQTQADVRKRGRRSLSLSPRSPLYLQERRNFARQLLRFHHDVSVVAQRHEVHRR